MPFTAADIEAEHDRALETLTKEQRWALYRMQRAYQESHFNHRKISENLVRLFEDEARRRNEAEAQHGVHDDPRSGAAENSKAG